jgi:plastocyanin
MRTLIPVLLATLVPMTLVGGGTIVGTVRAEAKPGTEQQAAGGKYDSFKYKFVERINYAELCDFIVYIDGPLATTPVASEKPVTVDTRREVKQRSAKFFPHVLPIVAGTTVEWPNNDDIFHNVFSASEAIQFDLGLYKDNPPEKRVTFDKAGRVDVFCSIHANMHCIVLVLQNSYFAAADKNGRYAITNVPPGTYKLKAWHERLPPLVKDVTVPENGEVKVDFTLGINNLPKY